MYKISYNQATTLENSSLEQDLLLCEKYNYDYIEIRSLDQLKEYLKDKTLEDLVMYFKENKIKPISLNALFNINNRSQKGFEAVLNEFQEMLEIAEVLEIPYIVAVTSFFDRIEATEKLTKDQIKSSCIENLLIMSDMAKKYGVNIAFEFVGDPINTVNTLGQALEILSEVDRDNVGLLLDFFHFHGMGSNLQDLREMDIEKLYLVHINDCPDYPIGFFRDEDRIWTGDGAIDSQAILKILHEKGYQGAFSIELFNPTYYLLEAEEVIATAKLKTENELKKYFK